MSDQPGDDGARPERSGSTKLFELAESSFDFMVASAPKNPLGYLGRGYARGRLGELDAARADFDEAVRLAPEQPAAYTLRGRFHKRKGDLGAAIEDFDRAVELAPREPSVYIARAGTAAARGNFEQALADYGTAIELAPESTTAHRRRGALLETLGRYEEARHDFERVIRLGDTSARAYCDRADAHAALDDFAAAIADYRRALRREPELINAHLGLARILSFVGETDASIDAYTRALELDPALVEPYNLRAGQYVQAGRPEEALADLNRAIELDHSFLAAILARGRIHHALGRLNDAVADFDLAIGLEPEDPETWAARGELLLELDDHEMAEVDFQRAIQLSPTEASYWYGLTVTLFANGDRLSDPEHAYAGRDEYHNALKVATAGLKFCPDDVILDGYRAVALRQLDAYDRAADVAEQALARLSDHDQHHRSWLLRELGASLRLHGELLDLPALVERGIDALEDAVEETDDAEEQGLIRELQGHALLALGRGDAALAHFRAAAEINPHAVWSQLGQGKVHLAAGRFEEALGAFDRAADLDPVSRMAAWARTGRWLALLGLGDPADAEAGSLFGAGPEAYLERAEVLEFFGAHERSLADRREAVARGPSVPSALNSLAWFHAVHGPSERREEALELSRRAVRILRAGDAERANYLDTAGRLAHLLGLRDESLHLLEEAVELDPLPVLYRAHLEEARQPVASS